MRSHSFKRDHDAAAVTVWMALTSRRQVTADTVLTAGFLAQHRVFRQHPVEVGAKPVGQVVGAQRSAEPARMEDADDPVAQLDPRYPIAHGSDLAGAIGKRHDAERPPPLRTIRSR